jgi:hypothetical protein
MRFQHSQRSLQLTPEELNQLKHLVQAHRTPQAIAHRAQLIEISHTHPDWGPKQIAHALNRHESWVRKWRRRWDQTHLLKDAPRSGAPRRFSPEVRAQVTALACSLPRSHGLPFSRWSRAELARHAARTPSLPAISASTVGRWLAAEQIRPWRYHSWQHIQKPDEFLSRARPVLRLYKHATALLGTCEPGSFVLMRKPRYKLVKQSKLLVRPSKTILCISHLATIGVEP